MSRRETLIFKSIFVFCIFILVLSCFLSIVFYRTPEDITAFIENTVMFIGGMILFLNGWEKYQERKRTGQHIVWYKQYSVTVSVIFILTGFPLIAKFLVIFYHYGVFFVGIEILSGIIFLLLEIVFIILTWKNRKHVSSKL